MFSQKKSFFKGKLFYMIIFGLFAIGLWLNQAPVEQISPEGVSTDSKYPTDPTGTKEKVDQSDTVNYDIMDNIIGKNQITTPDSTDVSDGVNNQEDIADSGYYLIKEIDGVIKVFFYDEKGKESLIRETGIAFSLLSVGDQALFQKGIIKHSEEELDELLQDFES